MSIELLIDQLIGPPKVPSGDVLQQSPDPADFARLEGYVLASELFGKLPAKATPRLGDACVILAECLARSIKRPGLYEPKLEPPQRGRVVALALAMGWTAAGRLCSDTDFAKFTGELSVPWGPEAETDVTIRITPTLREVMAGFQLPGVDSPFVDVYCVVKPGGAEEESGAANSLQYEAIDELLVVGRGFGRTQAVLHECCFSAAVSLGGGVIATDGLMYFKASQAATESHFVAAIGNAGLGDGFLKGRKRPHQRALNHVLRELKARADASRFVRIHYVKSDELAALRARLVAMLKTPLDRGCLMSSADNENAKTAGVCWQLPVRGSAVGLNALLPKALVTSPFFEKTIGVFEEVLLRRLAENAKIREDFHRRGQMQDRQQLSGFIDHASRVVQQLAQAELDEIGEAIKENKDYKDKVQSSYLDTLQATFKEATQAIRQKDRIEQKELDLFSAVVTLIGPVLERAIQGRAPNDPLAQAALELKKELDKMHLMTVLVDHEKATLTVLAEPEQKPGREYLGKILPSMIRKHLEWQEEMRELGRQIEAVRQSPALRRWTTGVVLDLVLRNRELDFGGPSAREFPAVRAALRPLLLMTYNDALVKAGSSPREVRTSNMVFGFVFLRDKADANEYPAISMQPYYFLDTRYSALWAPAKQKVCRLEDVAMRPKAAAAPPARDASDITADFDRLIDGASDAALTELTDRLVSDFRADPKGALAALFEARRPGERGDGAGTDIQLGKDREVLAGFRVYVRAFSLWYANAMPVALAMLTEAVQLGLQNKSPFTLSLPQNCLPDIPWLCLQFAAEMELRCGVKPRPVPGPSSRDGFGPLDLLRDWVVFQPDGRTLLSGQSGISDTKLRDLARNCIDLAEKWQPTILQRFLQVGPQARSVQSLQFNDVFSMIAGASKPEPVRFQGEDPYQADHRHRQRENFWAAADPARLRAAFKRIQAEENRWLLASLVRLNGIAEEAGRVGMRNWSLLTQALPDLMRVQLVAGLSQAEQVEVLLDQLIGAQHCRRRT